MSGTLKPYKKSKRNAFELRYYKRTHSYTIANLKNISLKKRIGNFLTLVIFLASISACSSDDPPQTELVFRGDLFLNTQEALDDFIVEGYTTVIGDVRIGSNDGQESNITVINPASLTNIQGILEIANTNLVELNGLNQLQEISGSLFIHDNPLLINFDGLENLKSLNALSIARNAELQNFNTLSQLTALSTVEVTDNTKLISLIGLSNVNTISANLIINGNPFLGSLGGLISLQSVNGFLSITGTNIESLTGLESLTTVAWAQIHSNTILMSLDGLVNLDEITGELSIRDNAFLDDFCQLQEFVEAEGTELPIVIADNAENPTLQEIIDEDCDND
ncbi:hypothetical protein [Roseivirga sp.]|uniref:hypothetical protein n=1 Tax=Roseivirga sp. TaxID=1964215 RepID=UPI003B8D0505